MKLLVLVHENFNDMELTTVLSVLNKSKEFETVVYFNPNLKIATGQHGVVTLNLVNDVNYDDFDAIFIPGGQGAKLLRNDPTSIEIIKRFKEKNKYIFAICDAPNVLYENGIIDNQIVYSSYPIPNIEHSSGALRSKAFACVQGKMFTGKCPAAALTLGLAIIKILFGEAKFEVVKKDLYGEHEPIL
ncbi:DJ-1/PfpI family protein [Mycoplasmopsis adleri]|uniref:DJ-1/PfpI family protein n=1 Tax=Mycoplasmopsis adleri TaxID=51362 RepID=UPI003873312E